MTFLEPSFLYASFAGVIVIALGIRRWSRRATFRKAFSNRTEGIEGMKPAWAEGLEILLTAGAMVCLAVALAGPVRDSSTVRSGKRSGRDILFVVDTSRSMLAQDRGTSRMARAKYELHALLSEMGGDRAGLVAFAGRAKCICPLTGDLSSLSFFVDRLEVDAAPGEGSALAQGIEEALALLPENGADRPRCMVLLSDGEEMQSAEADLEAAAKAAGRGVRVYTVLLGDAEGALIPLGDGLGDLKDARGRAVLSLSDPGLMRRIAFEGGGAFVAISDTAFPLSYLYERLLAPPAESAIEKEGRAATMGTDYQWPLLAGLVMLFCALFHPFRVRPGRAAAVCLLMLCLPLSVRAGDEGADAERKGIDLYRAGRFMEARGCFTRAREAMPGDPRIAVNLGLTLYRTESFDRAMTCFTEAMDAEASAVRRAARFGAGLCAFRMAEYALALSKRLDFYEASDCLLKGMKRLQEAQTYFERSIEDAAWIREALDNLASAAKLLKAMKARLKETEAARDESATSRMESGGGEADRSPGDGDSAGIPDGNREREGSGHIGKNIASGEEGGTPLERAQRRPLTPTEREEIFSQLRELEWKRMELEKETRKAGRRRARGEDR